MPKWVWLSGLLAVFVLLPGVYAEDLTALVIEAGGIAAHVKKGSTQRLQVQVNQTRLAAGDRIITGPNSRVKLLIEGKEGQPGGGEPQQSTVDIKAQSIVEVSELFKDIASGAENIRIGIKRGEVISNVRKIDTNSERFEVQTPTAVAAVRGTNFGARVLPAVQHGKYKVTFRVNRGKVAILDPVTRSSRRLLEDGDILDIEPNGAMVESTIKSTQGSGPGGGSEGGIEFDRNRGEGLDDRDDDTGTFPDRQEGEEDDTGGKDPGNYR